jgi:hypothetical protein
VCAYCTLLLYIHNCLAIAQQHRGIAQQHNNISSSSSSKRQWRRVFSGSCGSFQLTHLHSAWPYIVRVRRNGCHIGLLQFCTVPQQPTVPTVIGWWGLDIREEAAGPDKAERTRGVHLQVRTVLLILVCLNQ